METRVLIAQLFLNLYPHAERATTPDRPGRECPDNVPHMNQHVHKVEANVDDAAPSVQGNWAPLVIAVNYRPVTANQTPAGLPGTAGEVTRMIGAMQWLGRLTVPTMSELPLASARNVLVKKSSPFVELAGSWQLSAARKNGTGLVPSGSTSPLTVTVNAPLLFREP